MYELNVHAAHSQNIIEKVRNAIAQSFSHISVTTKLSCTSNLTIEWQALSSATLIASQSTLGIMERRHQDWFDDNAADIRSLIHNKNYARDALLRKQTSRTLHGRFSSTRATVSRKLRWMENNLWARKAAQIMSYANINVVMNFYDALKGVYGPIRLSMHPVRRTAKLQVLTTSLLRSLSLVGVLYIGSCMIFSLTAGLLSVSTAVEKCQHYSCIQAKG